MASGSTGMWRRAAQTTHFSTLGIHVRPARSIFSIALNFCCFAIAAFVRSPCRYCPFRLPGGPPLPLAPPCNRQRMTVSPSRPEARSLFGSETANELGAPVASSISEQLPELGAKFELVINLATATAFVVELQPQLLALADEGAGGRVESLALGTVTASPVGR